MSLKEQLIQFFGKVKERRVAVVGIGSPLRGDDAVGLEVVERLEEYPLVGVLLLKTETVPESFTGVLREFNSTHILMIDAVHLGAEPGDAKLIPPKMISNVYISTHKLSLSVLSNYLTETLGARVTLLGIQPRSVAFGTSISKELKTAARRIADTLYEVLSKFGYTPPVVGKPE